MSKEIRLNGSSGKSTLVDDGDFEYLSGFNWHLSSTGYVRRTVYSPEVYQKMRLRGDGGVIYMHREILGVSKEQDVDHINHDKLDNRRANLRPCTMTQNHRNRRKQAARGAVPVVSKYKGVSKTRDGKWYARIRYDGKQHYLGHFHAEDAAAEAYRIAALEHFGEFAHVD